VASVHESAIKEIHEKRSNCTFILRTAHSASIQARQGKTRQDKNSASDYITYASRHVAAEIMRTAFPSGATVNRHVFDVW
jgi:hypothetical protein